MHNLILRVRHLIRKDCEGNETVKSELAQLKNAVGLNSGRTGERVWLQGRGCSSFARSLIRVFLLSQPELRIQNACIAQSGQHQTSFARCRLETARDPLSRTQSQRCELFCL